MDGNQKSGLTRRNFIKTGSLAAVTTAVLKVPAVTSAEPQQGAIAGTAVAGDRRKYILSKLGDTLIPAAPQDPGYRDLEWHGITEEVLKSLSVQEGDLALFDSSAAQLYGGRRFIELSETERKEYLQAVIDGQKFQSEEIRQKLRQVYRAVRQRVFTVYYRNYPEHRVPRDENDVPLLRSGDTHQITNPNTDRLITGWDVSRFMGPLTWEEEERRRARFKKIDWHDEGAPAPPREAFATQVQFAAALRDAGSRGDPNKKYDLLIVGAGMAGCVLAARIAEKGVNPANGEPLRIGLIEWGPYLKGAVRPGYGHPLRRQLFSNVIHEFGDGNRYLNPWGGGCLVGGSAMHFNAQAFHPFDVDYFHWKNETGVDWTEENFREAVQEVKGMFNVHPVPESLLVPGQKLFEKAVRKLGYTPQRMEHARKNCIYCGIGCAGTQMCKYDSKMNSFVAYSAIAEKHGVEIIPDTKVEKVIIEKRGSDFVATGLWADQGGTKVQFRADKILLSASISGTPWILYNSGYGPRDLLGKDLLVENPNVGRNVDGKFSMESFPAYFSSPIKEGSPGAPGAYFFFQDGAPQGNDRLIFKETLCGMEVPDSMALHEFAPAFGAEHKEFMKKRGDYIAGRISLQHLRGEALGGYVRRDGEHVFPEADAKAASRAKEGLLIIRDIYREMGAEKIGNIDSLLSELERPGTSGRSRSPLRASHESGSCRAGVDRKNSVVNERFECHDIRSLFMCDLSVLPRVTCGNPGIAMAAHVACFAWRRIVQDHFSRS